MPNWNSCTRPVTTPIATLITSSVPKNRVSRRYSSRLLRYHAVCSSAVRNASPIVIGTKKKWLIVTNANCHLAKSTFMRPPGPGCRRLAHSVSSGHYTRRRRPRSSIPEYPADLSGAVVELVVEVDRGADQGQVAERLREVAKLLPGGADLLRIQAQVVGVGEHLFEDQPGLLQPPGAGQGVDVPERAQGERAFVAGQPVGGGGRVVPVDQAVGDQLAVHRLQGGQPHRVARGDEPLQRHHQERGVQHLGLVVLGERAHLRVPAAVEDLVVHAVALDNPPGQVGRAGPALGEPDGAVERDPGLVAGVGEVPLATAGLPDALVRLVPVVAQPVDDPRRRQPALVRRVYSV